MDQALFRLYTATFFFVLLMAVGFPLVPQHLAETFNASVFFIGLVAGIYGFTQIFLRLPMGDLADRGGRKPSLMATFGISAVAGLFYVFGPNEWYILVAQALFGLSSGIFWVAANAYLFDRVDDADIPRATADYNLAIGLGFLVGPPMGGYIKDAYGYDYGLSVFLWASVLGLLAVASLPPTAREDRDPPEGGVYERGWAIFQNPDIRFSAFGTFLFGLTVGVLGSFYPVFIRELGFTAFVVGVLIAARQGVALSARFRLPENIERFGPRNVLMVGTSLGALSLGLTPFVDRLRPLGPALESRLVSWSQRLPQSDLLAQAATWAAGPEAIVLLGLVLLALVAGLGLGIMVPANLTLVARGSPPDQRGLANGIYGTALGVGTALTSWILGTVGEFLGLRWTFWGSALMVGVLLVGLYLYGRAHPEEETPHPGLGQPAAVEQE